MNLTIQIQHQDFDQQRLYQTLASGSEAGAVVTFTGKVREFGPESDKGLWLEHYPAMTEKVLREIIEQAQHRWPILKVSVVHRVGQLQPGDHIVFVGVASQHRKAAFHACEFIMDFLKTEAPFWKKEGSQWVEAKHQDQIAADEWKTS